MESSHFARRLKGFSLIELMIAMVISLVLVVVASYSYLGTRQNYRSNDQQSNLYEEAHFALGLIGANINSAGYSPAVEPFEPGVIDFKTVAPDPIGGCDNGFDQTSYACPASSTPDAADALHVKYLTDDPSLRNNRALGVGVDCTGAAATAVTMSGVDGNYNVYLVDNWFFLSSRDYVRDGQTRTMYELSCKGNGSAGSQPLLRDIRDLQLLYGVAQANSDQAVDRLLTAAEVSAQDIWAKVISVQVCMLMETEEGGVSVSPSTYLDCNGVQQTAPQGFLRRRFLSTFNLRNRVTQ
ncbi:MAG: PilW family protein [Burkholderiaceae bacterium]